MCNFVLQLKYNVKNNNNNKNMQWVQKITHLSHKHNLFESSCHDNITKPNTFKLLFTVYRNSINPLSRYSECRI